MKDEIEIIIFGAGGLSKKVIESIKNTCKISYVIDNDKSKWGTCFEGFIIQSPSILTNINFEKSKIIIASSFYEEISNQLKEIRLRENIHFFSCEINIENIYTANLVSSKIQGADIVLDIGCGIRPQQFIVPKVHICCDPFHEYIEHLQTKVKKNQGKTSFIFIKATFDQILNLLPPKSIDTIFLLDVIEHIEKEEVKELLKMAQDLAKKQIIIFTPFGFMPQEHKNGKDAWGMNGGKWQAHKSGWTIEDFDDSWEIIIDKERHLVNNKGEKFVKPYSALWGIKTIDD
ncbi:methyltransferase domain-containing protein [Bacillus sp. CGMCC 1.16607]|uniref:methyltransferase domain-containing protein n=1 Tax=Bacillus sp. CGMCC 1.16607 TaxID=3351842 RepID=UPI003644C591